MSADPATVPSDADQDAPFRYTAARANEIELRWQDRWDADGTFATPNPAGDLADPSNPRSDVPKLFVLDMFPYPSGEGLHVGHPLGFVGTDVYTRYQRMGGRNVLYTMGYDAFGLPAEQFAVETGQHPARTTAANVANYRRQLRRLGMSHDRRRSIATTDPSYYRWTQWIFGRIYDSWYDPDAHRPDGGQGRARPIDELVAEYEAGSRRTADGRRWRDLDDDERAEAIDAERLAYVADAPVNWCPGLGTVVANEEVTNDGRSDRGNFPVFKRTMRQWMMRITAYADRLLDDLERLDWSDALKTMQRNWIGRSQGAWVDFDSPGGTITVFTTRPDTLFGATFLVLVPEHPLVADLTTSQMAAQVVQYRKESAAFGDEARTNEDRQKTGVFTGSYATNPANGQDVPIWIADYVLMGYGSGAIMAVPCGDQRDFEFARVFGLDIPPIQQPPGDWFEARRHHADPRYAALARGVRRRRPVRQLVESRRVARRDDVGRRRHRHHQRLVGIRGGRPGDNHVQAARLVVQPPALLGRAVPDRLRHRRPGPPAARRHAAIGAARHRQLLAADVRPRRRVLRPGEPARPDGRLGERHPRPRRWPAGVPPRTSA